MFDKFISWLKDENKLYKCFLEMEVHLKHYLKYSTEQCSKSQMCSKFEDVFNKCDEITYDEEGVAEAYTLFHFLDRYHRFQLIYIKMLELGYLPIKETVYVLDIGTGPGPSLFALSDIYELYRRYEIENKGYSIIKNINLDYVERSKGFLNFLHIFTEYANYKNNANITKDRGWVYHVPYHHGSFRDMNELKFRGWEEQVEIRVGNYVKKRMRRLKRRSFDLVIYSNFLTTDNIIEKFKNQIKESALYLKNKGVLLIVGGDPNSLKYESIYNKLDELILNQKYNNALFGGNCIKVIDNKLMYYTLNDIYGINIKKFYSDEIDLLTDNEWEKNLEDKFCKKVKLWCSPEYSKNINWYINLYKRHSYRKIKVKKI